MVFDPFARAGTTLIVAKQLIRNSIGVEIELDERVGIVDVRGKDEKNISVDDLDQLIHHCVEEEKKGKKVKGIFVANHYCRKDPKERPKAFTKRVIEFDKEHSYCLTTTVQLLNLIKKDTAINAIKQSILMSVDDFRLAKSEPQPARMLSQKRE